MLNDDALRSCASVGVRTQQFLARAPSRISTVTPYSIFRLSLITHPSSVYRKLGSGADGKTRRKKHN